VKSRPRQLRSVGGSHRWPAGRTTCRLGGKAGVAPLQGIGHGVADGQIAIDRSGEVPDRPDLGGLVAMRVARVAVWVAEGQDHRSVGANQAHQLLDVPLVDQRRHGPGKAGRRYAER
jgi:hypothetical protein